MTRLIMIDFLDNRKEISLEELEKAVVDEREYDKGIDYGMACIAVTSVDTVNGILYFRREGYEE